jgi:hypothetical protein
LALEEQPTAQAFALDQALIPCSIPLHRQVAVAVVRTLQALALRLQTAGMVARVAAARMVTAQPQTALVDQETRLQLAQAKVTTAGQTQD